MDILEKNSSKEHQLSVYVQEKNDSKNESKQLDSESEIVIEIKSDFVENKEIKTFLEIQKQAKKFIQQSIVPATPSDISDFGNNATIVDTAGYDTGNDSHANVGQSNNIAKESSVNLVEFKDEIEAGSPLKEPLTTGNFEFKYFYDKYMRSIPEQQKRMYFEKLASHGYNDIEMMLFLMEDNLKEDIGMSAIHVRLFTAKIEIFKQLKKDFERWMIDDLGMEHHLNTFLNEGIVTINIFYRRIQSLNKLLNVIGAGNEDDCQEMWKKLSEMNMQGVTDAGEDTQIEGDDYQTTSSIYGDNRYTHVVQTPEMPEQMNKVSKCCCKMQ